MTCPVHEISNITKIRIPNAKQGRRIRIFLFVLLKLSESSLRNNEVRARGTKRLPVCIKNQGQYRIILSADTASEVPQLPERCLSRKAGIVRCCPRFLQGNNAVHFPHPLLCSMVSSLSIHRASTSFSCSIKACPFSTGMQNTPVESASPRPLSLLTMATLFM